MVIVLIGVAILVFVIVAGLLSDDMGAWMREVGGVAGYLVEPAIRIILSEPLIALVTLFWGSVYIGTMIYFAQTGREKNTKILDSADLM